MYAKALQYHAAGWSIIPLKKDKTPLLASWKEFQNAACSEEVLEGWWDTWPDANIGIVTGKVSGITVVDIDTKGDTVTPLATFPETFTVRTPSGGYHLYYGYDPDIRQTGNTYPQFPHVDIRNDGGYVVGPHSLTSYQEKGIQRGGLYEVVTQMPVQRKRRLRPISTEVAVERWSWVRLVGSVRRHSK